MNYWHMQLEPGDNKLGFEKVKDILEQNIIGMGIWDEKSNQQGDFQNRMMIGDIVLIKSGATVIGLVKVTSNYFENDNNEFWFNRRRGVEILEILDDFKKDFPQPMGTLNIASDKTTETYKYIDEWYKRVHQQKIRITDIKQLQSIFMQMKSNKVFLYKAINAIHKSDIRQLAYIYEATYAKIEEKPVVYLRKKIIDHLKLHDIDETHMETFKNEVSNQFPKDVFRSWGDPFRILYSIYFAKYKADLESYFQRFISVIQKRLKIQDITKFTLVHFDGAQNQGSDSIWFAIYNKTYKSQKYAYQLFMSIENGKFYYGLLHMNESIKNELTETDELCLNDLISKFSSYLDKVIRDNSKEKAMITEIAEILTYKKQIILQGPPGTGKTRLAKQIANSMLIEGSISTEIDASIKNQVKLLQFHPSYSYEDFVRGIVAESNGDKIEYKVEDKILVEMAVKAIQDPNNSYVLIIDEINRANLSSVLGELIYALEYRGEPVESMYTLKDGNKTIILPNNLYIIGTMNTADRSIGHIDYAIRRRFTFIDVLPNSKLSEISYPETYKKVMGLFIEAPETYDEKGTGKRSGCLSPEFNFNSVMLGHSYFIADEDKTKLKYQVLPLLKEYISDGILIENDNTSKIIEELEKFANETNI